jgi:hypothetical protein
MTSTILSEVSLPPVVTGVMRTEVTLGDSATPEALGELSEMARAFFRLADLGAYVAENARPEQASCRVLREARSGHRMAWECEAAEIDRRFAQVFRNVLVMFNQLHHPVWQVAMRAGASSSAAVELPPLGSRPMDATYPPVSVTVPFPVHRREPGSGRGGRRVALEFCEPVSEETLKSTVDLLELWGTVSLGAYARTESDVWSGECAIFDALPDIDDDNTIVMTIERFGAPEVAWFSLLNLIARLHTRVARVARVSIE